MEQGEHDTSDHDAFLRSYLVDRDEECPMCSYNLRGLTGQVCPECGEALRIRVSLSEPKIGMYLCGVVGWAVGAGFSSIMLGLLMFIWMSEGSMPRLSETWPVWIQFIVQGSMLGLSLWKGRWIRKKSPIVRRSLAATAWILSVVFAVSLFAFS